MLIEAHTVQLAAATSELEKPVQPSTSFSASGGIEQPQVPAAKCCNLWPQCGNPGNVVSYINSYFI